MKNKKRRPDKLDLAFFRVYREEARVVQHSQCDYCYEPLTYRTATADHVVSRMDNGLDRKENLVAACEPCNKAKGHMSVNQFKKLIKTQPFGHELRFTMCWVRRRLNLALNRLERNVMARCK
jgi:5-methylcytosine-specific restriction endonuclease McrA